MAIDNLLLTIDVGAEYLKMAEFEFSANGGMILRQFAFKKIDEKDEYGEPLSFLQLYTQMLVELSSIKFCDQGCHFLGCQPGVFLSF